MPSFYDYMQEARNSIDQALALIGGTARPGATRRGRPPDQGRTTARTAARSGESAGQGTARRTLTELPAILAQKYAANGASPDEIAAEMGWKAGTPMSNLSRLVKSGALVKIGDRYHAGQAARQAA